MRLEGRNRGSTAGTAQKSTRAQRITRRQLDRECTIDYICPPDWCHAIDDVASASELPAADQAPLRSVTMSTSRVIHYLFSHATVRGVESGAR